MPLTAHRRHVKGCPHAGKGWNFTLCACPIWCDGILDGVRITQSLRTRDWNKALRWITDIEQGRTGPVLADAPSPSIAKAVAAFLRDVESRNLAGNTITNYEQTFSKLTEKLGSQRTVQSIQPETIEAYRSSLTMKASTWKKELTQLRTFFEWCLDHGWTQNNPAKKVRMPIISDVPTLPYTKDELSKLLSACDVIYSHDTAETPFIRQRARAILYTLLYSGLRIGDVTVLQRSALEKTNHLVLRVMKTGVPLKVLLHPDAADALRGLPTCGGNPTYFFWSGNGDAISCTKCLRRTVYRLGAIAKVHAHPHRFRDTFAVELLTRGADIRTVQHLLGHKSVRTTETHYAHFVEAHQKILDSASSTLDFRPQSTGPLLVRSLKKRSRNA
ncbi:MAG: tyrosine-type recombinase/integrase [Bryobacteraceae bacterium]